MTINTLSGIYENVYLSVNRYRVDNNIAIRAWRNEEGLALVTPKEVTDAAKDPGNKKFISWTDPDISPGYYSDVYKDGKEFAPERRPTEA